MKIAPATCGLACKNSTNFLLFPDLGKFAVIWGFVLLRAFKYSRHPGEAQCWWRKERSPAHRAKYTTLFLSVVLAISISVKV